MHCDLPCPSSLTALTSSSAATIRSPIASPGNSRRRYGEDVVVILADKLAEPRAADRRPPRGHRPRARGADQRGVHARRASPPPARWRWSAGTTSPTSTRRCAPRSSTPTCGIVVAAYNRRLGDHITGFFRDCTVLSRSQLAAPALVAAALGEIAPSHVRLSGRTLYVARRGERPGRPGAVRARGHRRPGRHRPARRARGPGRPTPTWCSPWPTAPRATRWRGSGTRSAARSG